MKHSLDARHEHLLDIINVLYEVKELDEMARELFSRLRQILPFQSAIFLPVARHTFEMQTGYCQDYAAEDMNLYLRHYAALDPLVLKASYPSRLNQAIRLSDAASQTYLTNSEFSSFLRQVPFRHSLGVLSGWRDQPLAAIRFYRRSQDQDFSATEINLVNRLAPHVASAIYLLETTKKHGTPRDSGLSVFGSDQSLIFRNEAARRALEVASPTDILAAARGRGIWRKNDSELYRVGVIPIRPPSLLSWLERSRDQALNLEPINTVESPINSGGNTTIVVTEPFRRRQEIAKRLASYQLSPREIEVSLGVMRGLSNSDVAQKLFIDEKTVKDHLQRIYAKTKVHSRTKMISRVLGLDTELLYSNEPACKLKTVAMRTSSQA